MRHELDVGRLLDAWVPPVGADHVHVVTVPPSGVRETWRRLASVLGVDPDRVSLLDVQQRPTLGFAGAELLRLLNAEAGAADGPDDAAYRDAVRTWALPVLRRLPGTALARLDTPTAGLADTLNVGARDAATAHGVHVVGDLADLERPVGAATDTDLVDGALDPPLSDVLEAAAAVRAAVRRGWAEADARREPRPFPAEGEVSPTELALMRGTGPPRELWDGESPRLRDAVAECASLLRALAAAQASGVQSF